MLNRAIVTGRLVRDPELRHTQGDTPVTTFTVACDRDKARGADGERQTDFLDVVAWRGRAEFVCKYFRKGNLITVSGRMQPREWTDKEGIKRRSVEINADDIYFGGGRRRDDAANNEQEAEFTPTFEDEGELPF